MNLIELQGSDRQLAWAKKIRKEMVENLIKDPRFNGEDGLTAVLRTDYPPDVSGYHLKSIILQPSAEWWIDHRDATGILGILKNEMRRACQEKEAARIRSEIGKPHHQPQKTPKAAYPYTASPIMKGERQLPAMEGRDSTRSSSRKETTPRISKAQIVVVQDKRTPTAQRIDGLSTAQSTVENLNSKKGQRRARAWVRNPGRYDVRGVDTKGHLVSVRMAGGSVITKGSTKRMRKSSQGIGRVPGVMTRKRR